MERLPGQIATATASTLRQSRTRLSSAACDKAGVELAPDSATTPAPRAAASRRRMPATKPRPSAKSR